MISGAKDGKPWHTPPKATLCFQRDRSTIPPKENRFGNAGELGWEHCVPHPALQGGGTAHHITAVRLSVLSEPRDDGWAAGEDSEPKLLRNTPRREAVESNRESSNLPAKKKNNPY